MGRIVTFYSFKGGVGRSMALANVAVLLARWGHRVLAVDFDLEAPGLENFFARSIDTDSARNAKGVVDLLSDAMSSGQLLSAAEWLEYTLEIKMPGSVAPFRLLTAGQRSSEYFRRVQTLDFREFYSTRSGGTLIERFRNELKNEFDFVLVDSRTGFTEIGGVCTVQLPDLIVLLFTATKQALGGGIDMVTRASSARQKLPFERPVVPILPVPSRLDMSAEFRLTQRWLDTFSQDLGVIFGDWLPRTVNSRAVLEILKLPHVSFFSYGETLPVLEQGTIDPSGLGYAYETLAALVAQDLQKVELLTSDRGAYVRDASKSAPEVTRDQSRTNIFISYNHADRKVLDDLRIHLTPLMRSRGLSLWDDTRIKPGSQWKEQIQQAISQSALAIIIISPNYLASEYMVNEELPILLAAAQERGLRVVSLVARFSLFLETALARFQVLNDPNMPLEALSRTEQDKVMVSVGKKIAEMAGQAY